MSADPGDTGRETSVIDTFLTLIDTLTSDFDALDLLTTLGTRSAELLDLTAAGIVLTDARGGLSVAAASSERSRLLEVFAVAIDSGPCVDCVRTGLPVACSDLAGAWATRRWPRFTAGAAEAGFRAAHALPLRLRGQVIGVLALLDVERRTLSEADQRLGQALADVATIGLLHARAVRRAESTADQLRGALESRVVIEQAKGTLAQQTGVSTEEAFRYLRAHARRRGLRLTDLSRAVVDRTVDLPGLLGPRP